MTDRWGALARVPVTASGVVRARRCLGMTQAELARTVGVGRVTVARWETGVMRPTRRSVGKLLDLLSTLAHDNAISKTSERFALVALFGGRVRLPVSTWTELLELSPETLEEVSVSCERDGIELAAGIDVGVQMERRIRGRELSPDHAPTHGERRLSQEILLIAEGLRA